MKITPSILRRIQILLPLVCASLGILEAAENLPSGPSLPAHATDNYGKSFSEWDGWIYGEPAKFAASGIARSGATSCEMACGRGGKIRIFSPKLELVPGRYRLAAFLRGLDITPGAGGAAVDFSIGLGDQFPNLKGLNGTFGWRPFTYVFEWPEGNFEKRGRISFGLTTSGRLWVDGVRLEAVGKEVALTPDPVIGAEEQPIAPPSPVDAPNAVRCRSCGYLNLPDWSLCYACGTDVAPGGPDSASRPLVQVFADFEAGSTQPFSSGKLETENPPDGSGAIRLDKERLTMSKSLDWSGYDYVLFDVLNPSDDPRKISIEIHDSESKGRWTRVNFSRLVPPGKSTVRFSTRLYVGERSRFGRALLRDKITRFVVGLQGPGPLILDDFRLERLDTSQQVFPGLLAFDFGPPDGPVMEGFIQESGGIYAEGRRCGWLAGAQFWKDQNALQPDALIQDFLTPEKATFRVDVPNGKYHVVMNLDSAGAYWGEAQRYKERHVKANGVTVVDDHVDYEAFLKGYLADADAEDLPGVDVFSRYVQAMQKPQAFDVEVKEGVIDIEFTGLSWANCLSHLVIYPEAKKKEGEGFLSWLDARRRLQFDDVFKQILPKRTGEKPPASGFRLFHRAAEKVVNAFDGPAAGDTDPAKGLSVIVAGGEERPATFSLQPGEKLGPVTIEMSPFTAKSGAVLPAKAVDPGWLDYRILRITPDGSIYSVGPRYWHPAPAPEAPGVTRTFWIRVHVPSGTPAGEYAGQVTVKPQAGLPQTFPLTVQVLPFNLPAIKGLAVGPWGSGIDIPWIDGDPAAEKWNLNNFEMTLEILRKYGFTSFSTRPHLRASFEGGKVVLDTSAADKEMEMIREKGFEEMISSYGIRTVGYDLYTGPTQREAELAGFANPQDLLKELYKAVDAHAKEKNWVPVAWNLCDEPAGAQLAPAAANAKLHREAAKGLERTTFMGATSMVGNDPRDPHYELLKWLPMTALTQHDEASIGVVRDAGNQLAYYNGGNRWTFGFYMKMLKDRHDLALRLNWHFNVTAGNPYYALDCREDDYCWFNTNARGDMVPSLSFLLEMMPGLNDYRYLLELDAQLDLARKSLAGSLPEAEKQELLAAIAAGEKISEKVGALRAGAEGMAPPADIEAERAELTRALLNLIAARTALEARRQGAAH